MIVDAHVHLHPDRLAEAIETSWGQESFAQRLEAYSDLTLSEADSAALLVSARRFY